MLTPLEVECLLLGPNSLLEGLHLVVRDRVVDPLGLGWRERQHLLKATALAGRVPPEKETLLVVQHK